jgi:hypothetical protein
MREYNFTPLNPPTTGWEVGAVVEDAHNNALPQPICFPSDVKPNAPKVDAFTGKAPAVSSSHDTKFDLNAGVSVPEWLKLKIEGKYGNVSKYSLVATGNRLVMLKLGLYTPAFNSIASYLDQINETKDYLTPWVKNKTGVYIASLWFADKLEYKFYSQDDVEVKVSLPEINTDVSGGWKSTESGSLIYDGTEPIALGFIPRPLVKKPSGGIGPGIMSVEDLPDKLREAMQGIKGSASPFSIDGTGSAKTLPRATPPNGK